jgi:DNA primase
VQIGYLEKETGEQPKYMFPPGDRGFRKSHLLFNLHRVVQEVTPGDPVVIVEGFFSVLWLHQQGYKAVGVLGCTMSKEQEELLVKHFQKLILLFDADEPGKRGELDCLQRLGKRVWVKVASLPQGKQPDELSAEQLSFILS